MDISEESATHAYENGVYYSNGNRAIRHLGIPTVTVPMGNLPDHDGMPVGLKLAGRAYDDARLLRWACACEMGSPRRLAPRRTPRLPTDSIEIPEPDSRRQLLQRLPRPTISIWPFSGEIDTEAIRAGDKNILSNTLPLVVTVQGTV